MTKTQILADNENDRRKTLVGNNVKPGTAFVRAESNKPLVTLTGSGDLQWSETFGPTTGYGSSGRKITVTRHGGGVGLKDNEATTTSSGSFKFPVTGATAATATNGKPVYAVAGAAVAGTGVVAVTSLTLTKGTNVLFGYVEWFVGDSGATETAVKIGA